MALTNWLECPPVHQKVVGLTSSQGTHLGFRFDLPVGSRARGNQLMLLFHVDVFFLSRSSPPSSLNKNSMKKTVSSVED